MRSLTDVTGADHTVRDSKGLLKRHVMLRLASSRVLRPPFLADLDMDFDRIVARNIQWAEERVALLVWSRGLVSLRKGLENGARSTEFP